MIGEEVSTRGGHLLALFLEEPIRPLRSLRDSIARRPRAGRPRDPGPPALPLPDVRPGLDAAAAARRRGPARPAGRARGVQPDDLRAAGPPPRRRASRPSRAWPTVGNSDAHEAAPRSARAGRRSPAAPRRTSGRRSWRARTGWHGSLPRDGVAAARRSGGSSASTAGTSAPRSAGAGSGATGPGRDLGYPGGHARPPSLDESATRRGRARTRREDRPRHARTSTRSRAASTTTSATSTRACAPAATTSGSSPPATASSAPRRATSSGSGRASRVPANGSVGTLTISPRYRSPDPGRPGPRAVRPAPLPRAVRAVPGPRHAARIAQREHRHVPRLRRLRARLPAGRADARPGCPQRLHGRIAVSAAARHFADRYLPGDYKVIPNGVDLRRFAHAVPVARWQDGRPNILFVGRLEPRKGLLHLLKAYRILRKTGCDCRLLVVGSGPQEREARRYVMTRRLPASSSWAASRTRRRSSCSGRPTSTSRRRPAARSSGSSSSRRWRPGRADRLQRHPRLQGRREARRAGAPRAARRPPAAGRGDPAARWPTRRCGRGWARAGWSAAEEFGWDRIAARVEAYYGFVIRRLAAQGALPPDFHAEVPARTRGGRRRAGLMAIAAVAAARSGRLRWPGPPAALRARRPRASCRRALARSRSRQTQAL